MVYGGVSKSFWTDSITKCTLTFGITSWEATQGVMAAKLTRLTHKIAIRLHLVAELYHLQFSLQATSPETFRYTLVLKAALQKSMRLWQCALCWIVRREVTPARNSSLFRFYMSIYCWCRAIITDTNWLGDNALNILERPRTNLVMWLSSYFACTLFLLNRFTLHSKKLCWLVFCWKLQ
jgi:hypothetical protein